MNISFSIITVTLNAFEDLNKTINSIQNQNYKNYTHIIKDGLSKDKTNQIDFSKFRNIFFYEYPDKGIYDAMNQGLKLAKNEFIIFLNAGDIFFSNNTLKELAENIMKNPNFNSYSGGTLQIDVKKNLIIRAMGLGKIYNFLPLSQLPHPSFVIKKTILNKLNDPFDSNLRIAGDYKQQLILRKKNLLKTLHFNQIISIMPIGGISNKNKLSILKGYKETIIFSFELYNFKIIYIVFIKLFLNIYSIFYTRKFKNLKIKY